MASHFVLFSHVLCIQGKKKTQHLVTDTGTHTPYTLLFCIVYKIMTIIVIFSYMYIMHFDHIIAFVAISFLFHPQSPSYASSFFYTVRFFVY